MEADKQSKIPVSRILQPKSPRGNIGIVDKRPQAAGQAKLIETIQKRENRTGLPDNLKTGVENLSGFSLDDVRVHYNSSKPAQLQALAYTQGAEIHIGMGQEKYLPHEVWHVVQQKQGRVQPTMQLKGVSINDNAELEKEADDIGKSISTKAYQGVVESKTQNLNGSVAVQRTVNDFVRYCNQNGIPLGRENNWIIRLLANLYEQEEMDHFDNLLLRLTNRIPLYPEASESDPISVFDVYQALLDFLTPVTVNETFSDLDIPNPMADEYPEEEDMDVEMDEDVLGGGESLDDFESESDEEFNDINTVERKGRKNSDITYHSSNDATLYPLHSIENLERDAVTIHHAGGSDNRLTIVCVQFLTSKGGYLRVAMSNSRIMNPNARQAAQTRGYVILQGIKTHGEANMILYAKKHFKDLKYAGHGCDKAACRQCEELMTEGFGMDMVDYGTKGKTEKYSGTYFHSGLDSSITSPRVDFMRRMIPLNYDSSGTRLLNFQQQQQQDILRRQILLRQNDCLIEAIAFAAGVGISDMARINIRLELQRRGIGIGAMMAATDVTVNIILTNLGLLSRGVVVHHNLDVLPGQPNDTLGNQGDANPFDIYHTGHRHFVGQQPGVGTYG